MSFIMKNSVPEGPKHMKIGNLAIFFLMVIFIAGSCEKEEPFVPIYDVPDEFQPHVDQFIIEAKNRGLTLEIHNLIIKYDEQIASTICGTCNSNSPSPNIQKIISINPDACWENDVQLETLIFHELGHCILGRNHTSEELPNGDPKSIMITNDISLYSPCVYDIGGGNCNQLFKREYYLDELFDEDTPLPDWGE